MKTLSIIVIGLCLLLGWCSMPTAHYRYRLTVEVDTPQGVKSGSAVQEVTWDYAYGVITSFIASMRAEAVFVDLGPGPDGKPRHVIALVPGADLVPKSLGYRFKEPDYQSYARLPGVHAVEIIDYRPGSPSHPGYPQFVTFPDIADPASARALSGKGNDFELAFGAGHALRRMTFEMVSPGVWPFSLIPASWPQWLFGEPITRGIEKRLPLLITHRERLWKQRTGPSDPYISHWHHFIRN